MPWFWRKDGDQFCVFKGTPKKPEKQIKCHSTAEKAQAHLAALLASESGAKKEVSLDGERNRVRDAFHSQFGSHGISPPLDFWVLEVFDTHVVAEADNQAFKIPYTSQGDDVQFASPDEWIKVEQEWIESKFVSYKSDGGQWRWLAVSSVAVLDREEEIVSEKAYDDAISAGREKGFGELDLVHINGTDVGDCDMMIRLANKLVEGGTWRDTDMATKARDAVDSDPDFWGVSIAFLPDREQFDGVTYEGGIRILKRTILPKSMAASYGTAIKNMTGGIMDDKQKMALGLLGQSDDEIAALEEKQKMNTELVQKDDDNSNDNSDENSDETTPESTEGDDVATKDKDNETEEAGMLQRLMGMLKLGDKSEPETEKATEEEDTINPATEEIVKGLVTSLVTDMQAQITKDLQVDLVEAINKALEPLGPVMTEVVERQLSLEKRVVQLAQPIEEQVADKLADLPPVVKVSVSDIKSQRLSNKATLPEGANKTFASKLFAEIEKSVTAVLGDVESKFVT